MLAYVLARSFLYHRSQGPSSCLTSVLLLVSLLRRHLTIVVQVHVGFPSQCDQCVFSTQHYHHGVFFTQILAHKFSTASIFFFSSSLYNFFFWCFLCFEQFCSGGRTLCFSLQLLFQLFNDCWYLIFVFNVMFSHEGFSFLLFYIVLLIDFIVLKCCIF